METKLSLVNLEMTVLKTLHPAICMLQLKNKNIQYTHEVKTIVL